MNRPTKNEEFQNRTLEEQRAINRIAERKGEEWAEEHAELILAQARLVGEL